MTWRYTLSMSLVPRFMAKVALDEADPVLGCWDWSATRRKDGYGLFWMNGRSNNRAHRVSYELFVGPIPGGLVVDHVCRNRGCVNPLHLRVCTRGENVKAPGSLTGAHNGKKTHCVNGHPFTGDNLMIRANGNRDCRECKRRICRNYWRKKNSG